MAKGQLKMCSALKQNNFDLNTFCLIFQYLFWNPYWEKEACRKFRTWFFFKLIYTHSIPCTRTIFSCQYKNFNFSQLMWFCMWTKIARNNGNNQAAKIGGGASKWDATLSASTDVSIFISVSYFVSIGISMLLSKLEYLQPHFSVQTKLFFTNTTWAMLQKYSYMQPKIDLNFRELWSKFWLLKVDIQRKKILKQALLRVETISFRPI